MCPVSFQPSILRNFYCNFQCFISENRSDPFKENGLNKWLTKRNPIQVIQLLPPFKIVNKGLKTSQKAYYWKKLLKFLFHPLNLNVKLWWSLSLRTKTWLFCHKSRSLIFHKLSLRLVKLGIFYMILTPLWMMKLNFTKPLLVLLQLSYLTHKLGLKRKSCTWFCKVSVEKLQHFNQACFFNFKCNASYTEAIIEAWFTKS